ncbi:MAG TPA: hypothetical protein VNU28_06215 [Solirubrobacteraceae bacterium]|nr:hypothetical protein [Solirubrobacteraceae bacterium]
MPAALVISATLVVLGTLVMSTALAAPASALSASAPLVAPASAFDVSTPLSPTPTGTSATITPTLSADRLRARVSLTIGVHFSGGELGVPSPLRHAVLRLPAGMSLEVPSLRACSGARLQARGLSGCPARSRLGAGKALVEARAGSQTILEKVALWAFIGPPQNLQPTFEILALGYTPLQERVVLGGTVLSGSAPYGEALEMSIPPIATLPGSPEASILAFSLTVGAGQAGRGRDRDAILTPPTCPPGGFPFAADFTYADGTGSETLARIPCPS